jgi:hypothetical protein
MFVAKICSEQIEEIHDEFIANGFNVEIKPEFIININEDKEKESEIRELIVTKNLPVFIDWN